MLDYTIVAGQRVLRNIRRVSLAFNVVTQVISILILAYITFTGAGILPLNISLLALSSLYLVFYCATVRSAKKNKTLRKRVAQFFKWSKRGIKLVNLGVMLYALFTNDNPSTLDVILPCASLGFWVLDILLEIAAIVVKSWGTLMKEAVLADIEQIPIVNRFLPFGKTQEGEEPAPPTKQRLLLDGLVAERKEELEAIKKAQQEKLIELKAAAKLASAELKKVEKQKKKALRLIKRQAKKRGTVLDETAATDDN